MKLSRCGQIVTPAAFVVNNLQQTDYRETENIDVDLGDFWEAI